MSSNFFEALKEAETSSKSEEFLRYTKFISVVFQLTNTLLFSLAKTIREGSSGTLTYLSF